MKMSSYGIVDFKTVTDTTLSIQARGIYCYFVAYANKQNTAFPSRERILSELGLSKNGYYKHFSRLEKIGILTVSRKKGNINRYHIKPYISQSKSKYAFVHKDIMLCSELPLAAKVLFAYITAFCPTECSWHFQKTQIMQELGISSYLLNKSLRELSALKIIDVQTAKHNICITNLYQIISNNEDTESEKRGHETLKKEDTKLKKRGHGTSKNEDREYYNINNTIYQSGLISPKDETDGTEQKIDEKEIKEVVSDEKMQQKFQHNCYYFLMAMLSLATEQNYMAVLNGILEEYELTFSNFVYSFLTRYEYKTKNIKFKNPIRYMRRCLQEFTYNYTYLKNETNSHTSLTYGLTYDVAAYERDSMAFLFSDE